MKRAPGSATRGRGGMWNIAAFDVSVLDGELRNHLADYVVQVRAAGHVLQPGLVLLAQRLPIVPVHIRGVEKVAIPPPDLVENLRPFLLGTRSTIRPAVETVFFPAAPVGVASISSHASFCRTSTLEPSAESAHPPLSSSRVVSFRSFNE